MAGRKIDTSLFPKLQEGQSSRQALEALYRYCFELTEQLSYLLNNLGEDNFNRTELKKITGEAAGLSLLSVQGEDGTKKVLLKADGQLHLSAEGGVYINEIKVG